MNSGEEHFAKQKECTCGNLFFVQVSVIKANNNAQQPTPAATSTLVAKSRLKRKALLPKRIDHSGNNAHNRNTKQCSHCTPLDVSWILDPNKYSNCCRQLLACCDQQNDTQDQQQQQSSSSSSSQQESDNLLLLPEAIQRKFNVDNIIAKLSTRAAANHQSDNETNKDAIATQNNSKVTSCCPPCLSKPESIDDTSIADNYRRSTQNNSNNNNKLTKFGLPKLSEADVEVWVDGRRRYKCPVCPNVYANRSGLNRHYVTHSENDQWKSECVICGKKYSRKDSLKHHIKTQHHLDNDGASRVIARSNNNNIRTVQQHTNFDESRSLHLETSASPISSSCESLWVDEDVRRKKRKIELQQQQNVMMNGEIHDLLCDVVSVIQRDAHPNRS